MTSLTSLLPEADDTVRCAEHARTITVDPGGTAIRADRVIVVATPLPWPKPALDHPLLAGLRAVLAQDPTPTRLLAAVPDDAPLPEPDDERAADAVPVGAGSGPAGGVAVTLYRRAATGATEQRFRVAGADDLTAWGQALVADEAGALGPWSDGVRGSEAVPARPAVLLCVQGSHDVCCGAEGMRLANELVGRPGPDGGGVVVHRVSHTGGHRFAPTAMTLPDGRMWADLDQVMVDDILSAAGPVTEVVDRCRGWWGAETGPAQVAERAVFGFVGWGLDDQGPRVVREVPAAEGAAEDRSTTWSVSTPAASWTVTVRPGRQVPTIACRQPGGLPAKQAQEYEVVRLVADAAGPAARG